MKFKPRKFCEKALAVCVSFLLINSFFLYSPHAAVTAPTPSTGTVVVSGADEGDKFSAYKIIETSYNAGTNTLSYAWCNTAAQLQGLIPAWTTVEDFADKTKDARQALLSENLKYIINGGTLQEVTVNPTTPSVTEVTVGADGQATFAGLEWGQYLLVPTAATSVYEVMLGSVGPISQPDGSWVVGQPEVLAAKKSDGPTFTKVSDQDVLGSVGSWTTITYTLTASVPIYDEPVVGSSTFKVEDNAPANLVYKGGLKIYGVNGATETLLTTATVTVDADKNIPKNDVADYNLILDFVYSTIKDYEEIKITYTAKINNLMPLKDEFTNAATLTYSTYPYVEEIGGETPISVTNTKTASDSLTTYGLEIFKYDLATYAGDDYAQAKQSATGLGNASFKVYRHAETGETGEAVTGITGNVVEVDTITTATSGVAQLDQLKAGTYYLVETQAPSGYTMITAPIPVTFTGGHVDANGRFDVLVSNNKGITLPQTGSIGSIIFIGLGIAVMAGAIALFVISEKKKRNPVSK